MEYLRYTSFLNAVSKEFKDSAGDIDGKTQRKMLGLATKIIDAFAEIYGEHDLKRASSPVSRELSQAKLCEN